MPNHPKRKASPSNAQIAANRANARKSTGPRTAEGKARSRRNATRHGVTARLPLSIVDGPFAEDDDEVQAYLEDVVQALAPRDILEEECAWQIAFLCLRERRHINWEVSLLQPARQDAHAHELNELHHHGAMNTLEAIEAWNEHCDPEGDFSDVEDRLAQAAARDALPWEDMARLLKGRTDPDMVVKNLWTAERTPEGEAEWRRAFRAIVSHHCPRPDDLRAWLRRRVLDERRAGVDGVLADQRDAAVHALKALMLADDVRGRTSRESSRQWARWDRLRERPLAGEA